MRGEKVTCATCANEDNRKCLIKKSTVALNKRRRCDFYKIEATKVKERQILKTVPMGYQEKEALRKEYKEQLRRFKENQKAQKMGRDPKYPLTGDLSRFTSTAGKVRRGG